MKALVVGDPADALASCAAIGSPGTLVWDAAEPLRDAADALEAIGWDALLIDPDDEQFSTASMAFRAQVNGPVPALVLHASTDGEQRLLGVAIMVARHLPALPVILTGPGATEFARLWQQPCADLELEPPILDRELAPVWAECVEHAESQPPPPAPAHHH